MRTVRQGTPVGADSATGTRVRRPPALAVLMGLLAVALALGVRPVRAEAATTINVTTTADGGAGSLRAAIATANADTGAVVISVPPGTYDLTAGVLNVGTAPGATISIVSSGTAANTVIRQTTAGAGVFNLDPNQVGDVAVTLQNLTITGGDAGGFGGGGILAGSPGDVLNVTDCIVTGNRTQSTDNGGGIGFEGGGTLNITGSTISNNTATAADGGGLFFNQSDALTISDSTFSGNQATAGTGSGEGAGIFASADPGNAAASESITGSALVDNQAAAAGGAIYFASGLSAISFDRIVGNSAASGSAIAADTAVTAANDWWGCNGGPGQSGCDTEADTGGSVTTSPFLVLTLQVAPTTVATGSGATATASLTQNSSGTDTAAQGHVPNGTPVTFAGTLGTVSPASGSTTSGAAVATFTAGASAGAGEVTATVDNQSVNTPVTIGSAPAVTSQPADQSVAAGQTATFAAAASGSPSPTVQWQVSADGGSSWSAISGATATSLSLTAETSENGNQYRAVFANAGGSAASNAATLTMATGPTVTAQPADQSVVAGQTATFTATASGSPSPTVQWQVSADGGSSWSAISGATATSLRLTAAASENGNQYRAVFANAVGAADSGAATLTVEIAPTVSSQPADQSVAAGQTAIFTAAASGVPSPTVQWQVSTDGGSTRSAISGATATSLRLTAAASENGNQYRAVFTNAAGAADSNAATLTMEAAPTVMVQPADQTVVAGQTAIFTAAASGNPTPTVQWQVSTDGGSIWSPVSGATSTSLRLAAEASDNGNAYRAVFTNAAGSADSATALLKVTGAPRPGGGTAPPPPGPTAPTVTSQPPPQTVPGGRAAVFTATAAGSPAPSVQWQVSSDGGVLWAALGGATFTTLRFQAVMADSGNLYRAVFTNAAGTVSSGAALLTVTSAASPAGPVTTPHDRFRLSGAPAGTAVSEACGGAVGLPAHEVAASCVFTVTGPSTHRPGTATLAYAPAILGALSPERLSVYARGADGSWTFVPTAVGAATDTVSVDVAGPGTLVVLADTRRFTDVPPAYWAARAIDVAGAAGIVNGMPQGTFRPGAVVTRADFVAMLARLQGVPPSPGPTPFADVPATTWYAGYVRAAVATGWVRGTSATTFSPDAALTREQMAVLLARALGLSGGRAPSFTDASAIAPWAAPAVRAAVAAGYLEGFPDGSFDPGGTATRAQAAAVVARVIAHRAPR